MLLIVISFFLFCVGHLAIWCTLFNQIHATSCPKSARRGSEILIAANVALLGIAGAYLCFGYPNLVHPGNLSRVLGITSGASAPENTNSISRDDAFSNSRIHDSQKTPAIPVASPASLLVAPNNLESQFSDGVNWLPRMLVLYWHFCVVISFFFIGRWLWWRYTDRKPDFFIDYNQELLDLDDDDPELLQGLPAQLAYAIVPGNQILSLCVDSKTFAFPNLPPAFDGYKIAHLSDLHFTGRIGKEYFRHIVELTNQWEPDLICITGDLLDKKQCLDWIDDIYGQLHGNDGVLYILGNHDRRVKDEAGLRSRLNASGMVDTNGIYHAIERSDGQSGQRQSQQRQSQQRLWFAGNELPWFPGAARLEPTDKMVAQDRANDFFITLCHSPDQWPWAQRLGFDLMLAGHTHGGQVRIPLIGPIIAPSRFGVRYASGVFQLGSLAMQVSRGISGADPLRWNCPPELCQLTLRRAPGR